MTQSVIHSRIHLTPVSTLAAVVTFGITHVNTGSGANRGTDTDAAALRAAVKTSCSTLNLVSGAPLGHWIGDSISRASNACYIEFTDVTAELGHVTHGSPDWIDHFTLSAISGTGLLPEGIAMAVGWHSDYGTDPEFGAGGQRPKQRDRNRMYVGPLMGTTLAEESPTNRTKFGSGFINDMVRFVSSMDDINGGIGTTWSIAAWSKANASVKTATTIYVDDRPDYQRRRSHPGGVVTTATI